jgi:cysteate synthase
MKYQLRCLDCGATYPPHQYICRCKNGCTSLLRTDYSTKKLTVAKNLPTPWRYHHWLPITTIDPRLLKHTSTPRVYRSTKIAKALHLNNLILCLNTYPDTQTGSFKDLEAEVTFQRLLDSTSRGKPLVFASDGNNAISFTHYAHLLHYPIILFATEDARQHRIWSYHKDNPTCHLYPVNGDYSDAIALAAKFSTVQGTQNEGGAYNVGRRDAVATIYLDAVRLLGKQPDHYFQALGSGPGAIAVYETHLRLQQDGHYGKKPPKLHGSQNTPFTPMADAWINNSDTIDPTYQGEAAQKLMHKTYAHVLTNRFPVYSQTGGVHDVFTQTHGEFYRITKTQAIHAQTLFKKHENISIVPEAGVTIASLQQAITQETIHKDDTIVVNITGGGRDENHKHRYCIPPAVPRHRSR